MVKSRLSKTVKAPCFVELIPQVDGKEKWFAVYIDGDHYDSLAVPKSVDPQARRKPRINSDGRDS